MGILPSSRVGGLSVRRLPDVVGLGGAIAGVGGGLAMALTGALIAALLGHDLWLESKQIAVIIYGDAALAQDGFVLGPVVVGTAIHFLVSALLGALFGIVSHRLLHLTTDFGLPVYSGLMYGLVLWVVNYFLILPLLNPALTETYGPSFLIQHVVYGMVTGLLYIGLRPKPYQERRMRRAR